MKTGTVKYGKHELLLCWGENTFIKVAPTEDGKKLHVVEYSGTVSVEKVEHTSATEALEQILRFMDDLEAKPGAYAIQAIVDMVRRIAAWCR